MELGGWRTRSMLCRYNVVSETDLANALERVSAYVSTRATEATKITPLNVEPAQNPHRTRTIGPRSLLREGRGAKPAKEEVAARRIELRT